MNENSLKKLWQKSNEQLDQNQLITKQYIEDITQLKVQSLLSPIKPIKIIGIIVGLIWVVLGTIMLVFLFNNAFEKLSPYFVFAASLQLIITAIALVIYIYQTILIYQIDLTEDIISTQEKLTQLKSSSLLVTRILFLQLPLWSIFYWHKSMFQNGNIILWIIQIIITLTLTILSIWLFFSIKYENKDKKWFQWIFSGKEWSPIIKAMELNNEIRNFKNGALETQL